MPELPEVETVLRSIRPLISGGVIRKASFRSRLVTQGDFSAAARALKGRRIQEVRRVGKNIFIELDRGFLHVHLGMTGRLLWNAMPTPYTRAIIELEHGSLVYDDVRQFGRVNYYPEAPEQFSQLGPDALSMPFPEFFAGLHARRASMKALLLNQAFISGIGNIYADEALFAAKIHPKARSNRVSKPRALRLHEEILKVLEGAIAQRGSSISDYVDANGAEGNYQLLHRVYGKAGHPCANCGTPIRRIVVGQRGTHYCPKCQRP